MGLGALSAVPLRLARELAAEARQQLARQVDPIDARRAKTGVQTFANLSDEVIRTKEAELRNAKSVARWRRALLSYAEPIGPIPVDKLSTADVLTVLRPIWTSKPETAQVTRACIEAVLDAARAKGQRTGENPARWRGHLDHLLPKPSKLVRGHHAAMSFDDVPAFLARLRERAAPSALAMEFLILTAARSGEVLGMTWTEVDFGSRLWTVPGNRMKAGREHRVPLSDRAIEVLDSAKKLNGQYVFPGQKKGRPLSSMAFEMLLRRPQVDGGHDARISIKLSRLGRREDHVLARSS
jgi:integrase